MWDPLHNFRMDKEKSSKFCTVTRYMKPFAANENSPVQARSYVQARGGSFLLVPRRLNFFETQINVTRNCVKRKNMAERVVVSFTDKISDIKQAVARDPNPCSIPPSPELVNAGPVLVDLTPVTPAEVLKIINTVPPKSSRLDYVPTSLIKVLQLCIC